jgi:hypothetical protein
MRVSYREDPAVSIDVDLIQRWERGEIDGPVMSASSGPKDYARNHIWAIFDRYPDITRVVMLRGEYLKSAVFLLVVRADGQVFDMAGKQVVLES